MASARSSSSSIHRRETAMESDAADDSESNTFINASAQRKASPCPHRNTHSLRYRTPPRSASGSGSNDVFNSPLMTPSALATCTPPLRRRLFSGQSSSNDEVLAAASADDASSENLELIPTPKRSSRVDNFFSPKDTEGRKTLARRGSLQRRRDQMDTREDINPRLEIDTGVIEIANLPLPPTRPVDTVEMEEISRLKHLCNGSQSNIFKGWYGDKPVIVKVLRESSMNVQVVHREFQREIEILRRIQHPHVVTLKGSGTHRSHDYEDEHSSNTIGGESKSAVVPRPFMVLECLSSGILSMYLAKAQQKRNKPFSYMRALTLAREFASVLKYLHADYSWEYILIHRDLKPDNIGFSMNGTLKVFDFGLVTCVRRGESANDTYKLTGKTGTKRYMAPEVYNREPYNEKVDMYSFGIILYQILSGCTPFAGLNVNSFEAKVIRGGYRPSLKGDDFGRPIAACDDVRAIITASWDADFNERLEASQVYEMLTRAESFERRRLATRSCWRKLVESCVNNATCTWA